MKKLLIFLVLCNVGYGSCVAHYKLNDDADTNAIVDSIGSHDGIFHGAGDTDDYTSAHNTTGKVNGAIQFDGTNDYIDALDHNDFSPVGTPFSVAAWVQLVGENSAVEFEIANKYATNQIEWAFFISSDALYFNLWDNVNGGNIGRKDTNDYSLYEDSGSYIFVVATYDGSNTSAGVNLYLDGDDCDCADEENGSYSCLANTTSTLQMAYRSGSPNKASGMIDNVMVFDEELTAAQVLRLYNDGDGTENPNAMESSTGKGTWRYRTFRR